jgi:hypothetical protein
LKYLNILGFHIKIKTSWFNKDLDFKKLYSNIVTLLVKRFNSGSGMTKSKLKLALFILRKLVGLYTRFRQPLVTKLNRYGVKIKRLVRIAKRVKFNEWPIWRKVSKPCRLKLNTIKSINNNFTKYIFKKYELKYFNSKVRTILDILLRNIWMKRLNEMERLIFSIEVS